MLMAGGSDCFKSKTSAGFYLPDLTFGKEIAKLKNRSANSG